MCFLFSSSNDNNLFDLFVLLFQFHFDHFGKRKETNMTNCFVCPAPSFTCKKTKKKLQSVLCRLFDLSFCILVYNIYIWQLLIIIFFDVFLFRLFYSSHPLIVLFLTSHFEISKTVCSVWFFSHKNLVKPNNSYKNISMFSFTSLFGSFIRN